MKVLHVIPSIATVRGGPSQAVVEMVKALRERSIEVEIATTNDNGPELLDVPVGRCVRYQNLPVWFFPRFSPPIHTLREFAFSSDLTTWLWQNIRQYDLLHIHAIFSYPSTVAMAIARLQKVPYIVRPLGQLCEWSLQQSAKRKQIYLQLIEQKNLNYSQFIHFTSEQEQQEASQLNLRSPSFVLPHGLVIPARISNARQRLRQHFNLPADEPIILFLSRVHPKKGLDYLIKALAKLSHHRFTFILAGSGTADYELEVQSLLSSHHLQHRTQVTGFVQGEIKDLLLQGADLFTLTSYSENFGVAVLEALAVGLPVLLTPGVALADLVDKQQLGCVTKLDVDAISDAIEWFLTHPVEAKLMGDRARQLIIEQYSWAQIATKMSAVYIDIIQSQSLVALKHS
ncbi:glycosyltransferase [Fortiea contorta]|uniref:glycosyltransferase n=1 Tax=Fortiea contorta TaxID=1892405 RepID=UPI0003473D8A|nr:glycosyltransferase [Fortiea contorta]